ncbi:MAG: hypothetical protein ACFWTR_04330 [Pseudomonas shahriarae]
MGAGLPAMAIGVYTTRSFWLLGMSTYPLLRLRPLRVPPLRRLTLEERQSKQSALAPPLGASLRLGMPAVRHCSVGPPRSAIPGRVAATPASMPGCPLRNTCLRPAWFNGAPKIKIKSQIKSRATATAMPKPGREAPFPCGSCLALRGCDSGVSDNIKASSAGAIAAMRRSDKPAPTGICARFDDQVGCQAASLCF